MTGSDTGNGLSVVWDNINYAQPTWTDQQYFAWNVLMTTTQNPMQLDVNYAYDNPDGNEYEHLLFFAYPDSVGSPNFDALYAALSASETETVVTICSLSTEFLCGQITMIKLLHT